jgi:predicted nuclease of predicted toxin-antitoxin system
MSNAPDSQILSWASELAAVVVTLDADFHMLLAVSGAIRPSVVRVRIEGLRAHPFAQLIQEMLRTFGEELGGGAVVTVKARKITCHRPAYRKASLSQN